MDENTGQRRKLQNELVASQNLCMQLDKEKDKLLQEVADFENKRKQVGIYSPWVV